MEQIICPNCGTENAPNNRYCSRCGHSLPVPEPQPMAEQQKPLMGNPAPRSHVVMGVVMGIVLLFLVGFAISKALNFDKLMSMNKDSLYEYALSTIAEQTNKSCPIIIDSLTRMDNVTVLPGNTFQYNYTLKVDKSQVDIARLQSSLEASIVPSVKSEPSLAGLRSMKTTLKYSYSDKNAQHLMTITVTPDMYEE
jgi:hypothetical protein